MRSTIWAMLCVISVVACLAQQQPSFEETTNWIIGRLPEAGYQITVETRGLQIVETFGNVKVYFDGCKMNFRVSGSRTAYFTDGSGFSNQIRDISDGAADLALISAPTLKTEMIQEQGKTEGPSEVFGVVLRSQSLKQPAFTGYVLFQNGVNSDHPTEDRRSFAPTFALGIWFQDQSMAERVMEAFTHAVALCGGGKAEPF